MKQEIFSPARAAEKSPLPSTLSDFCRLGRSPSIQATPLDLGLAFKNSPHKTGRPSHQHESYMVTTLVPESEAQEEGDCSGRALQRADGRRMQPEQESLPAKRARKPRRRSSSTKNLPTQCLKFVHYGIIPPGVLAASLFWQLSNKVARTHELGKMTILSLEPSL